MSQLCSDGAPHWSNEGYAMAKRILECQVRFYRKERHCDYICVIPTNLFGPNDNYLPNRSHVIPALIQRAYERKERDKKTHLDVYGSGKPLRQFLYSIDAAV